MFKSLLIGLVSFVSVTLMSQTVLAQSGDVSAQPAAFERTALARQVDLSKYNYVDPGHSVPTVPLRRALTYYDTYYNQIQNKNYVTVVDFTKDSNQKRMFLIDMHTGKVSAYLVAHGQGSDPSHTGRPSRFSNNSGSNMSSLGLYLTGDEYYGSHPGKSLRLNGLEASNSNALDRAIVIHGAWYVDPQYTPLGRSNGCPAVEQRYVDGIADRLKNGSVYYIWAGI